MNLGATFPLAARGESTIGRAHGACGIWVRGAAQREFKARGGGDAGTSLTTSNAEIALGLRTQFRNPHAAGPLADPGPFGFRRRGGICTRAWTAVLPVSPYFRNSCSCAFGAPVVHEKTIVQSRDRQGADPLADARGSVRTSIFGAVFHAPAALPESHENYGAGFQPLFSFLTFSWGVAPG